MKTALLALLALILLYVGLRGAGWYRHRAGVRAALEQLRGEAPATAATVSYAALDAAHLPGIVKAYLERSLSDGAPIPRIASLRQRGGFRLKAGQPFMGMEAEQLFSVQAPGLVWQARMKMVPGLPILVRDTLIGGHGTFGGRLLGLVTVAAGSGPETDEATLVRYLSEAIWFPYALLPSDRLRWEAVGDKSARAILDDRGHTVTGVYAFDDSARPIAFDADRARDVDGTPVRTPWHVTLGQHTRMAGVEIPSKGTATWRLPEGPLEYGRFEITSLAFESP